jgi:hypothetical protein
MTSKNLEPIVMFDKLERNEVLTEEAMEKYKKYSEEYYKRKENGEVFREYNDKVMAEDDYEYIYEAIKKMRENGEIKFVESIHSEEKSFSRMQKNGEITSIESIHHTENPIKKVEDLKINSDSAQSKMFGIESPIETPPLARGFSTDSDSPLKTTHSNVHNDQLRLFGKYVNDTKETKKVEEDFQITKSKPTL